MLVRWGKFSCLCWDLEVITYLQQVTLVNVYVIRRKFSKYLRFWKVIEILLKVVSVDFLLQIDFCTNQVFPFTGKLF